STETKAITQRCVSSFGSTETDRGMRTASFMVVQLDHHAAAHSEELARVVGVVRLDRHPHGHAAAGEVARQAGREILASNPAHATADRSHPSRPGLPLVPRAEDDRRADAPLPRMFP